MLEKLYSRIKFVSKYLDRKNNLCGGFKYHSNRNDRKFLTIAKESKKQLVKGDKIEEEPQRTEKQEKKTLDMRFEEFINNEKRDDAPP